MSDGDKPHSSTTLFSQASSLAIAIYSSLYAVWSASASLKQPRGKRLGKSVTGAVIAKDLEGSMLLERKVVDGRTARPLSNDQSLTFDSKYSN